MASPSGNVAGSSPTRPTAVKLKRELQQQRLSNQLFNFKSEESLSHRPSASDPQQAGIRTLDQEFPLPPAPSQHDRLRSDSVDGFEFSADRAPDVAHLRGTKSGRKKIGASGSIEFIFHFASFLRKFDASSFDVKGSIERNLPH